MSASLAGVWAKIERGHEHVYSYRQHVTEFFATESNKAHLGVKFDTKTGEHILYVHSAPDWTDFKRRTALMIGDAIQNFRSALDYLVYQLALMHTKNNIQRPNFVQFPITDCSEKFRSAAFTGRRPGLREVHPDHAAIIEGVQPYGRRHLVNIGGVVCNPLVFLRDASDADKHRLLTTVFVVTQAMGIRDPIAIHVLFGTATNAWEWANLMKRASLELGTEIARRDISNGAFIREVDVAAICTPRVAFPEGWPVGQVLDQVEATAKDIVSQFLNVFP
jgi:hypothetical protein